MLIKGAQSFQIFQIFFGFHPTLNWDYFSAIPRETRQEIGGCCNAYTIQQDNKSWFQRRI